MTLELDDLAGPARFVRPAVSRDMKADAVLRCICIEVDGGSLRLIATDSYRLAIAEARVVAGTRDARRVLVGGDAFDEIPAGAVTVDFTPAQLRLRAAAWERDVPVANGEFPAYERVLAGWSPVATAIVETAVLVEAIKRADSDRPLRVTVDEGSLNLGDDPPEVCDVKAAAGAATAVVDAEYAHVAAVALGEGALSLEIVDEVSPIGFRSVGEPERLMLVMPVRIATPRPPRKR